MWTMYELNRSIRYKRHIAVCVNCGFKIEFNTNKADLVTLSNILGCCAYPYLVYED